jgi:AcrR family transcriptional regulator
VGRIRSTDYDDIRETIIDRAASVFARQGFVATSISDIAEACACSRSRLYHYFDNKEALLREILGTHVDTLLQRCEEVASEPGDAKEKFLRIVKLFMEIYAVSGDRHVVMLTCLDALPEHHRQEVIVKQRKLIAFVRDALLAIRPDSCSDRLGKVDTMLFFGMINWTYTWYKVDGAVSSDDLAERAVDIFLNGFLS